MQLVGSRARVGGALGQSQQVGCMATPTSRDARGRGVRDFCAHADPPRSIPGGATLSK